uniref:Uncharacterized protein n=1 Tax=Sipha flava TaxID=143950 RepID=A0A2S2QQ16_9HEMI
MPTRPCSQVRRTPQQAEESVDQRRRSRFTITGFSAQENFADTDQLRFEQSSHTYEVIPGDGDSTVLCCNHKNTRPLAREKRRVGRSQRKFRRKKVPELTRRSKILEHHTPTLLSGAPVNTKWDNLNGDVTLARTISFSNSNCYINRAKQICP